MDGKGGMDGMDGMNGMGDGMDGMNGVGTEKRSGGWIEWIDRMEWMDGKDGMDVMEGMLGMGDGIDRMTTFSTHEFCSSNIMLAGTVAAHQKTERDGERRREMPQ